LALARRGVRWIVDLRDPWVDNPGRPPSIRSGISDALDRRSERTILKRATAVVVGTDRLRIDIVRRHPELVGRVHVIPAGVDADDFERISRAPAEKFRVAHFGEVYHFRSPEPVFAALSAVVREGRIPRGELEIMFAGEIHDVHPDIDAAARRGDIIDLMRLPGFVPRRQALQLMASAGALILLAQAQPLQVPSKTFEYLAAGPPIIALAGDGATADLIRQAKAGWVVAPGDHEGIRTALLTAYADWRRRLHEGVSARPVLDARFDRRELTGHLASLLDGERA
jgi:glycosyltransferase involved in cell wall biosynthesis